MKTEKNANPQIKRFRVFDIENQTLFGKFETLQDCYKALKPQWERMDKKLSEGGNPYLDFMIDDVKEDMEINWADVMEAFDSGDIPEDLQHF